jgi:tetratricopeptide (TPR) repeat protein
MTETTMRLSIPTPPSWRVSERRGRTVAALPHDGEPDALLEWGALELLPDEQKRWVTTTLRVDVPQTAKVDVKSDETTATEQGWPIRLVEAEIRGSDDAVLERRLFAFYAFFEHAATASFRSTSSERFDEALPEARALLRKARPDWSAVGSLSEVFDVGPTRMGATKPAPAEPAATPEPPQPTNRVERLVLEASGVGEDKLREVLARTIEAIDEAGDDQLALEMLRCRLHRALGEGAEALASIERASALGAAPAEVLYVTGLILADLGRESDAVAAWKDAAAIDPYDIDALYNAGLAAYKGGRFVEALEAWTEAFDRAPDDFWLARKVVQAQFADGRYDEAAKTGERLREIWRSSTDPAVQLADEFVFDQFEVGDATVYASETLRPRNPSSYSIFTFRVEHVHEVGEQHAHNHPRISVQIETSDYAKSRGVPYVISVVGRKGYRVIGTSETLPPYAEIKKSVSELIAGELGVPS